MTAINDPSHEGPPQEVLLLCALQRVWRGEITTKSDYSRSMADEIAEAASRGFITTILIPGKSGWGRVWRLTPSGASYLFEHSARIADLVVAANG